MRCYRIATKKYASALSGEGARLYGGRWNTEGTSLIYTAQTSSLAMLEILAHMRIQLNRKMHFLMVIEFSKDLLAPELKPSELDANWAKNPPNRATKIIGNTFVTNGDHAILPVPSAVNPLEVNYLINDLHPDFKKVRLIETLPIDFDRRLVANL